MRSAFRDFRVGSLVVHMLWDFGALGFGVDLLSFFVLLDASGIIEFEPPPPRFMLADPLKT